MEDEPVPLDGGRFIRWGVGFVAVMKECLLDAFLVAVVGVRDIKNGRILVDGQELLIANENAVNIYTLLQLLRKLCYIHVVAVRELQDFRDDVAFLDVAQRLVKIVHCTGAYAPIRINGQ